MFITKSLTKKKLEELIKQSFQFLNFSQASNLGDFLKGLGFYYATASGISISLEDLKTPTFKKQLVTEIEKDFEDMSRSWALGLATDVNRFQSVIDNWNLGAEVLKQQIVEHFQINDPLNTLYIMAFSGARGNMSQVRQVIGMRGLMVNQEGNIIDLPIQANFREGLSSIDYIVSSYGARKGVVDTALKTADAGYMTRRLIYVVQEITIKAIDCKTSSFQSFFLNKKSSVKDLLGKTLIKITTFDGQVLPLDFLEKTFLTEDSLNLLKKNSPLIILYRAALNCKIKNGICQACYGWDISKCEKINLGLAVGVIAAQSIGEPGTQLTMRTFHTGGIFTSQFLEHKISPASGKLTLPLNFKTNLLTTSHGKIVPLLLEDIFATLTSWNGKKTNIFIPRSSFLHFQESSFVKKNQVLSELQPEAKTILQKKRHPLRVPFDGLILNKELSVRVFKPKSLRITRKNSKLLLTSGVLYEACYNSKSLFKKFLNKDFAFAFSKILAPINGIVSMSQQAESLRISNALASVELKLDSLSSIPFKGKIEKTVKSIHFVDAQTIIAKYYYYPNVNEKIYRIKSSKERGQNPKASFFFITKKDIWKIYYDSPKLFAKSGETVFSGDFLTPNLKAPSSGILLEKDGFKHVYQRSITLSIPQGTLLSSFQGKFLQKNEILAYLVLEKQKGEDIVQGLPKIEELLEARKTKRPTLLFSIPSIFLGNWVTNATRPQIKNLSSKNTIYKVDFYPRDDKFFEVFSKIRKLPLNSTDRRSVRRIQRKRYFVLNFFQGIISSKKFIKLKNTSYEMLPVKKLDSFNLFSHYFYPVRNLERIEFSLSSNSTIDFFIQNVKLSENNGNKKIDANFFLFLQEEKEHKNLSSVSFPYIRPPKFPNLKKNTNFGSKDILREFPEELASAFVSKIIEEKSSKILSSSISLNPVIMLKNEVFSTKSAVDFDWHRLQSFSTGYSYFLAQPNKIRVRISEFVDIGRPITEGRVDPHRLLSSLFYYHYSKEDLVLGTSKSVYKLQLILLNSIQSVYRSQGVEISNIHIELIVRELTSKVKVQFSHGNIFYLNEVASLRCMTALSEVYAQKEVKEIFYEPILLPISKASLQKEGFLTAAGFQETRFVLTKAAVEGKKDWIRGLKDSIIIGRLIPAGSGFLSPKNCLDTLFYYKSI